MKKITLLALVWALGWCASAQTGYTAPASHRAEYNLNYDWKFIRQPVSGAEAPAFDDSGWRTVSLPHTYNDVDLFDTWVTGSGNYGWAGKTWYRKRFRLSEQQQGRKVFIEFEGVRQALALYVNGQFTGRHENGVGPCGIDITPWVVFGATDNVLAVEIDNTLGYKEVATGENFQWNTPPFNPNYGGIVSNVRLHVTDPLYQTLPLYSNLGTQGVYLYADHIQSASKTADLNVQAEIINSYAEAVEAVLAVTVVDKHGQVVAQTQSLPVSVPAGDTLQLQAVAALSDVLFWSPDYPNLYEVYTSLSKNGECVDVCRHTTGIRQVEFSLAEGLTINGRPLYLKGYAPRTTMEWVSVGMAPNWMGEYDFALMKESNANFIRPMHCGPKRRDVEAADKFGIIYACPAGDGERDSEGRQWEQRTEVMRDLMIYFRNNPSVVFYEGGNQYIAPEHMQEMVDLRHRWDPHGGRFAGTRSIDTRLKGIEEYGSTMDGVGGSSLVPVWDAEYARAECPRRVWDKYTPPYFGYANIADASNEIVEYPSDGFKLNSTEDLALNNVKKYYDRYRRRAGQGLSEIMVGGAKIIFADGVSHGRMEKTELARVTGSVDAARLPKSSFYSLKVAQSDTADICLLGHWNYPAGTVKPMYAVSNMDAVELAVYDTEGHLIRNYGRGAVSNGFIHTFADVEWVPGRVVATGYIGDRPVKQASLETTGEAVALRLTAVTGPQGWLADGSDIAMVDVEAVDAQGRRVPDVYAPVHFAYAGQGTYLGGYNSGREGSIFQDDLELECGVNRLFVRAGRTAGDFILQAASDGLTPASLTLSSTAFDLQDGLTQTRPQGYEVHPADPPEVPVFRFNKVTDAPLNSVVISDVVTVSGFSETQSIHIESDFNAAYSINGGAFTQADGTIRPGDALRVRLTTAGAYQTSCYATITIGTASEVFTVITKDAPPVQENIAYQKPATASSEQMAVTNINDGRLDARWTASAAGYPQWVVIDLVSTYRVDSLELCPYGTGNPVAYRDYQFLVEGSLDGEQYFTLSDRRDNTVKAETITDVFPAQQARYVRITFTGAATYTGGWVSIRELRLYEAPADTVPDAFAFTEVTDAELFSACLSNTVTISGIDGPARVSLSDNTEIASFSINSGLFQSEPALIENGDRLQIRLGTGSQYATTYRVRVTVGGTDSWFLVTTQGDPTGVTGPSADSAPLLYPTPAHDRLYVRARPGTVLTVANALGRVVKTWMQTASTDEHDVSDLPAGLYLVSIRQASGVVTRKVVVR